MSAAGLAPTPGYGPVAVVGCGDLGMALLRVWSNPSPAVDRSRPPLATTRRSARLAELAALGAEAALLELAERARLAELLRQRPVVFCTVAPGEAPEAYVTGVANLAAVAAETGMRHLIFISSIAVYGQNDGAWLDESAPASPTSPAGRALLAAETSLLEVRQQGVRLAIVRLAGLWSANRGPANVASRWAGRSRADGEAFLNLVHRDDAALALHRVAAVGFDGVLNLADGAPRTRRDFYDPLLAVAGLPGVTWLPGDDRGRRIRNDLARRLLDWTPRTPA